jgi:hypothetical protein
MPVTVTLCDIHWSELSFQVVFRKLSVSVIRCSRAKFPAELGPLEASSLEHRTSRSSLQKTVLKMIDDVGNPR